jgi:hypothetical protein
VYGKQGQAQAGSNRRLRGQEHLIAGDESRPDHAGPQRGKAAAAPGKWKKGIADLAGIEAIAICSSTKFYGTAKTVAAEATGTATDARFPGRPASGARGTFLAR